MLQEIRYNVLIVSSSDKFIDGLTRILPSLFNTPSVASSLNHASRLMMERNYDILIINSPVNGLNAVNFSLNASDSYSIGILLLVPSNEYPEAFDKTNIYGILTLSKPTQTDLFIQTLSLLCSSREKINKLKRVSSSMTFKEKMEEIKLVNEAKLLLMKEKNLKEEEAHKFIEKKAMNSRLPKYMVAKEIISKLR